MKSKLLLLLVVLVYSFIYCQSQEVNYYSQNIYMEKGNYYFDKKDFKKAIVYYNMSFSKDGNYHSLLKKAEAYMDLKLYDQAAECYRIFFNSNKQASSEHMLNYALVLLKVKNITGFEKWIRTYNVNIANDIKKKGASLYKDSTIIIVENEGVLNSGVSEISPVVYDNGVLFSSTRKNLTGSIANDNYNVFKTQYSNSGQLGRLNMYSSKLDSEKDDIALFVSDATKKMYFSRKDASGLKTYVSSIPVQMHDPINVTELKMAGFDDMGQVSLNSDGTKMYFVSDAPGGSGGMDIYTADFVNGNWTNPTNLGNVINTPKDELYPFVLNQTLYFASNGHNGLGGLDLYSVDLSAETMKVQNLGNKINSKYDESGLKFSNDGLTGYFSSNRPGGFGEDDIYRLHRFTIKVEKPTFKFKQSSSIEDGKINLYMNDGSEYNIASKDKSGFHFSFRPEEGYKMVIQHENPVANNIISNTQLSDEKRLKAFLNPKPYERTEIELENGMVYHFHVGNDNISDEYKKALKNVAGEYQNTNSDAIDLTILARELLLKKGEIYTIHFEKDNSKPADPKNKEITNLTVNDESIEVKGRSFFILLPLDIESNFNIETDIDHFKEAFNPKKVGKVTIDTKPIITQQQIRGLKGYPILVNTDEFKNAKDLILADEFSITPGCLYMFSLRKSFYGTDANVEIFVPMTKGVQYNLGSEAVSAIEYDEHLVKMKARRMSRGAPPSDDKIGLSVVSKQLEISPKDSIVFTLMPVQKEESGVTMVENVTTEISIDGQKLSISPFEKWTIMLKVKEDQTLNLQTDLDQVQEQFDESTIELAVDKESFSKDIAEEEKDVNTDPVFDVIVVNFNINQFAIRPDAKSILDSKVINELKANEKLYVTIKGYTDPLGDAEYNKKLSADRANSVKDYLTSNGVGENRIRTFSFGETASLKQGQSWENLSEAELQKHRKVEIKMYLPR